MPLQGSITSKPIQIAKTRTIKLRRSWTGETIYYPDDTERPKPLLRKLFLNIVLDQKDIFTSPFRVNRHDAVQWLVPMAVTGALIASDTHIADAFENSRGQIRWGGRISDIGASYTLIPIVAGSYVYGAWRDNPKGREIGVLGTQSLLDSLIVVGVLKEVFRRNRPDEKNPGDFWGGGTSFPSVTPFKYGLSPLCWITNSSTRRSSA
jgi:hypothetical protein